MPPMIKIGTPVSTSRLDRSGKRVMSQLTTETVIIEVSGPTTMKPTTPQRLPEAGLLQAKRAPHAVPAQNATNAQISSATT
jgi:hypothetical protein